MRKLPLFEAVGKFALTADGDIEYVPSGSKPTAQAASAPRSGKVNWDEPEPEKKEEPAAANPAEKEPAAAEEPADKGEEQPRKKAAPKTSLKEWQIFGKSFKNAIKIVVDTKNPKKDQTDPNTTWYTIKMTNAMGKVCSMMVPSDTEEMEDMLHNCINRAGMVKLRDYLNATYHG